MSVIREATVDDAPAIAAVHVGTWREAYRHIFPPEFLAGLSLEHRSGVWQRILDGLPESDDVYVAEDHGRIVGFCHSGPSRDDDGDGRAEVYAIYVAPECWGRGVGRQLMEAARAALARGAWKEATLWVLEPNTRARVFYERDGWIPDALARPIERGGATVLELRYHTGLSG
jgi:ribosomal protein S18 acetylase RimI-like enzyme